MLQKAERTCKGLWSMELERFVQCYGPLDPSSPQHTSEISPKLHHHSSAHSPVHQRLLVALKTCLHLVSNGQHILRLKHGLDVDVGIHGSPENLHGFVVQQGLNFFLSCFFKNSSMFRLEMPKLNLARSQVNALVCIAVGALCLIHSELLIGNWR